MKRASLITLALLSALSASHAAWAVDYPLPPANSRLIGENQFWTVQEGDRNLQAIARGVLRDRDVRSVVIMNARGEVLATAPTESVFLEEPILHYNFSKGWADWHAR